MHESSALLHLLQLASPALPVGAFSYSEGLETLVDQGTINDKQGLQHWLTQELRYGAIRIEAAVMVRAERAMQLEDKSALIYWNHWLSAARETAELRSSSWQMGRSLIKLLLEVEPQKLRSRLKKICFHYTYVEVMKMNGTILKAVMRRSIIIEPF